MNKPKTGVSILELKASVEAFQRGMRQVAEAAKQTTANLGKLFNALRRDPRLAHGYWNFTGDGLWQSNMCAAWLHEDCPLTEKCDCTCHGGELR